MPDYAKIFTYEVEGLSYTVSLYEENGQILADIAVTEGSMDVNAVYFGDDDFSGKSESLAGPLNMNGASLDGEKVQWDDAVKLSDPGIGPEGEDKETYLQTGDTLTIELDVDSLDDIDIFGIRATSTTTDAGSIKAVSDDPEEPDDPEDPEDPQDPTYHKVLFAWDFDEDGDAHQGVYMHDGETVSGGMELPEGTEPTFENYLAAYTSLGWADVADLDGVAFYDVDDAGTITELFRFDAPEGGFQSEEEVLEAYEDALEIYEAESGADTGEDLLSALALDVEPEELETDDDTSEEDEYDYA